MKKPNIGVSTKVLKQGEKWYNHLDELGVRTIEINNVVTPVSFQKEFINLLKKELKGYDLSMHTSTNRIFSAQGKDFRHYELEVFRSEIVICSLLGVKELIFHLTERKLAKKEEKQLRAIINFARKKKVDLIYESNKDFNPDTCLDVLRRFPKLKYNLDIGHMNIACRKEYFNYKLDDFINKIKNRIVYMHIHSNYGDKDYHLSLKKGTLDWRHILNLLDFKGIRKIIIEQHDIADVKSTKKDLDAYFKKRKK